MITVVIPNRESENSHTTLHSLARQTLQPSIIINVYDRGRGANWARNQGFNLVTTPYVLFSDNDIVWEPNALEVLYETLINSGARYAYGAYMLDDLLIGNLTFDAYLLRRRNYISTMSLCYTEDFPGFDENIQRLQDWDVWLTYLDREQFGIYCGQVCFRTAQRPGITFGGQNWAEARNIIIRKHRL